MPKEIVPNHFEKLKHLWNRGHDLFVQKDKHLDDLFNALGLGRVRPLDLRGAIKRQFDQSMSPSKSKLEIERFVCGDPGDLKKRYQDTEGLFIPKAPDLTAVEDLLEMPGLFETGGLAEVTQMIEATYPSEARMWKFTEHDRASAEALVQSAAEAKASEWMWGVVSNPSTNERAAIVKVPKISGISVCASALAKKLGSGSPYATIYLVQPGLVESEASGCDRELCLVMEDLGLSPGKIPPRERAAQLLRGLQKSNALLVIATHQAPRRGITKDIIKLSSNPTISWKETGRRPKCLLVLDVDPAPSEAATNPGESRLSIDAASLIDVPEDDESWREPLFQTHLTKYEKLRRPPKPGGTLCISDTTGFRTNWCRRYFASPDGEEISPMEVRLLALFCSNRRNFSFHDPTVGWRNLVGDLLDELPLEVELYRHELELYVKSTAPGQGKGQTDHRVLKVLSTAVFWLRGTVLAGLIASDAFTGEQGKRRVSRVLVKNLEHVRSRGLSPSPVDRDELGYTIPLGLKAIVQDRWKDESSQTRSRAHRWIAQNLYRRRNVPGNMSLEYPFEPNVIGSQVPHTRAEILRHFVRSEEVGASDVEAQSAKSGKGKSNHLEKLESLSQAYEGMFRVEMNMNPVDQTAQFEPGLGQHFGAYRLSAEVHQLMEPWAKDDLEAKDRFRFLRHLSYACIDIGDLEGARCVFDELERVGEGIGGAYRSTAALDRLLLLSEIANESDLETRIDAVADDLAILNEKDVGQATLNRLNWHLTTRRASLDLSRTRFSESRDALLVMSRSMYDASRLSKKDEYYFGVGVLRMLEGRAAHIFVDATLGDAQKTKCEDEKQSLLADAWDVCQINVARERQRGRFHAAHGFEIQMAYVHRVAGRYRSAEIVLVMVYEAMLSSGGSIRTYLSLLDEAGKTLSSLKQLEKAYYLYFRRHLETCKRLGFTNRGRRVLPAALGTLKDCASMCEGMSDAEWKAKILVVMESSKGYGVSKDSVESDEGYRAPYSGYWHPDGRSRFDLDDLKSPPEVELRNFETLFSF